MLRNHYLGGAAGELPLNECWPEIWVLNDEDLNTARRIVDAQVHANDGPGPGWRCSRCGEALEPQFFECWNCGERRAEG